MGVLLGAAQARIQKRAHPPGLRRPSAGLQGQDRPALPGHRPLPAEAKAVFGPSLKPAAANRLLRIMHGRRVAGTLDDPAFAVNTAAFTAQQRDAALAYLRKIAPVDEVLNAGLRAEDELAALEKELAESADKDPSDAAAETATEAPKGAYKADPVYGYSALDAIRAKNQAKAAEEEKRLAEEAKQKDLENPGTLATLDVKRPPMSPRMQKWTEQASSDLEAPPPLTLAERLLPPRPSFCC
ncbi:rhomboid family protein [Colletotrichum tofieldiae]|nr:rhomboid family protein [Colletotrichum tofieldiae]